MMQTAVSVPVGVETTTNALVLALVYVPVPFTVAVTSDTFVYVAVVGEVPAVALPVDVDAGRVDPPSEFGEIVTAPPQPDAASAIARTSGKARIRH